MHVKKESANSNITIFVSAVHNTFLIRHESTEVKPDEHIAAKENNFIIKDTEKGVGDLHKHEFQADTKMLLDTVARSLYSEKEVNYLSHYMGNFFYYLRFF